MYTPNFDNYEGLMDYDTYKKWVTQFYANGRRWNSEIDWKKVTENFYANKPSRKMWNANKDAGGSHWTLFSNEGWQMAPDSTKKWKNKIQRRIRTMIHRDEFEMSLHKETLDAQTTTSSASTVEDKYWEEA
jgi:hypothetical protein